MVRRHTLLPDERKERFDIEGNPIADKEVNRVAHVAILKRMCMMVSKKKARAKQSKCRISRFSIEEARNLKGRVEVDIVNTDLPDMRWQTIGHACASSALWGSEASCKE